MSKSERRKHPRVKIYYPISCDGLDENGNIVEQYMGIALDISQNGLLIETSFLIESRCLKLMAVDQDNNNLIEIKGKVVYSKQGETATKYKTGLRLQGTHTENVQFAQKLIRAFYYHKKQTVTEKVRTH